MMKVLLLNGSPHPHGCTFTALSEVAGALELKPRFSRLATSPFPAASPAENAGIPENV